jgi:hypothetical protein
MTNEKKNCPHCGNQTIWRSRRRPYERTILGLLRVAPFRCQDYNHRFYMRTPPVTQPVDAAAGTLSRS